MVERSWSDKRRYGYGRVRCSNDGHSGQQDLNLSRQRPEEGLRHVGVERPFDDHLIEAHEN
jgi:hypothetical protein